jgi:hypothetical protein
MRLIVTGSVLFVLAIWIMCAISNRVARHRRREFLMRRGSVTFEEWYQSYFQPLGASRKWSIAVATSLANAFRCHPTNFRPTDCFDTDLALRDIGYFLGLDCDDELNMFESVELVKLVGSDYVKRVELGDKPTVIELIDWCQRNIVEEPASSKNE